MRRILSEAAVPFLCLGAVVLGAAPEGAPAQLVREAGVDVAWVSPHSQELGALVDLGLGPLTLELLVRSTQHRPSEAGVANRWSRGALSYGFGDEARSSLGLGFSLLEQEPSAGLDGSTLPEHELRQVGDKTAIYAWIGRAQSFNINGLVELFLDTRAGFWRTWFGDNPSSTSPFVQSEVGLRVGSYASMFTAGVLHRGDSLDETEWTLGLKWVADWP